MTTKYVVDMYALIWFLEGNPCLGVNAKAVLDLTPNGRLGRICMSLSHHGAIPTMLLSPAT